MHMIDPCVHMCSLAASRSDGKVADIYNDLYAW